MAIHTTIKKMGRRCTHTILVTNSCFASGMTVRISAFPVPRNLWWIPRRQFRVARSVNQATLEIPGVWWERSARNASGEYSRKTGSFSVFHRVAGCGLKNLFYATAAVRKPFCKCSASGCGGTFSTRVGGCGCTGARAARHASRQGVRAEWCCGCAAHKPFPRPPR